MNITSRSKPAGTSPAGAPLLRHGLLGATLVSAATVLAGCNYAFSPLASQDSFFASPSSSADRVGSEASATIEGHRALLAVQRACGNATPPVDQTEVDGQGNAGTGCRAQSTPVYGRRAEAYRRWVEDNIRVLPAPSETATSSGG